MTQPPPPPPGPQQPPHPAYGAPPPGTPPYAPYGQPPPYPTAAPARQGMSPGKLATVVVAVVLLISLLVCAGAFALGVAFFRGFEDVAEWDPDRVGGRDNPIRVDEGEAFTIDGMDYAGGWEVRSGPVARAAVRGLEVTNDREDRDPEYASITFTFLAGGVELSQVSCDSDGVVEADETARLDCYAFGDVPAGYDEIEVHAS